MPFIRNQFTCYCSFYDAIAYLPDADRLAAYDMLMSYALYDKAPDPETTSPTVMAIYALVRPNIENGKKKAKARLGYEDEPDLPPADQTEKKKKEEDKSKDKCKDKCKKESYPPHAPREDFDRFWAHYPRKEGRAEAEKAFGGVGVGMEILLSALERQKALPQWQKEGGRYIPLAAHWLSGRRWEDAPPQSLSPPADPLGDLELQAIRDIMHAQGKAPLGRPKGS